MKKIVLVVALALLAFVPVSQSYAADTHRGSWAFDDNPDGWELLRLKDNSTGNLLILGGSERYCVTRGDTYARMRAVLERNYEQTIVWWIDARCRSDNHVRVCVRNYLDEEACSTYAVKEERG